MLFSSFYSRIGTSDWPSLEVAPLSKLRKNGAPDYSPIRWCPVISQWKQDKTKNSFPQPTGYKWPNPGHLPILISLLSSSLTMLQPHALLTIPASKLLCLLFPLPRKPFPRASSGSSHAQLLSSPKTQLQWHLLERLSLTTYLFLFYLQTVLHFPVSSLWQWSISKLSYLFIHWLYFCLSGPSSPFCSEGRDHTWGKRPYLFSPIISIALPTV